MPDHRVDLTGPETEGSEGHARRQGAGTVSVDNWSHLSVEGVYVGRLRWRVKAWEVARWQRDLGDGQGSWTPRAKGTDS